MSGLDEFLGTLPTRGWKVVRFPDMLTLTDAVHRGYVKAHRSGPGPGVFEVRLTGRGRQRTEGEPMSRYIRIKDEAYCLTNGCVHADTTNPYDTDSDLCSPEDHRVVYARTRVDDEENKP